MSSGPSNAKAGAKLGSADYVPLPIVYPSDGFGFSPPPFPHTRPSLFRVGVSGKGQCTLKDGTVIYRDGESSLCVRVFSTALSSPDGIHVKFADLVFWC